MEELIRTIEVICIEHYVMRSLLAEDKQISRVKELCRLKHYRDAVQSRFREMLGSNLDTDEIGSAQLLAALSTTTLDNR